MTNDAGAPPKAAPGASAALGLDDVVHQRVRLGILCVLGEIERAEFTYLRQLLELSDGNLARHLGVLVDAGHVSLTKDRRGPRPRTWAALTAAGKEALRSEVEALDRIVRAHRGLANPPPDHLDPVPSTATKSAATKSTATRSPTCE